MTYCYGPCLNIAHDITKGECLRMCFELTKELNNYYKTFHKDFPFILEVVPEPITEGGFMIKYYIRKNELKQLNADERSLDENINETSINENINETSLNENINETSSDDLIYLPKYYKSMRIRSSNSNYPWVRQDYLETWKNNYDETVYKRDKDTYTFLKAFERANKWSCDELKIFFKVFCKHGIYYTKRFPKEKQLNSCINGYKPFELKDQRSFIYAPLSDFK